MSSSSSTPKQQQQQQQRRRINHNNNNTQQSRNTNAYFDHDEYHRRSLINNHQNYWNQDYQTSNENYYQHRNMYSIRKGRQIKNEQRYNSKSGFSTNNNQAYYYNTPPRHRLQQYSQESRTHHKLEEIKSPNSLINHEQPMKPLQSASLSSTNSDVSNNAGSTNRKDLQTKNLAAAAIAARQQNSQPQTNLNIVQGLMNSLILQQQQQQQPSQSQSTIQLQYQLTNALLATMIQQRLKEAALQAQAQQIQAALPTLLAAQALVYQQSGQLTATQQQAQSILPPNVANPGTKFNNRPLVKFPMARPMIVPTIRPPITANLSRHRLGTNTQQTSSTTTLPTYQQVQEIERGISLDEAIHLKSAIDIADMNHKTETTSNITE